MRVCLDINLMVLSGFFKVF